MSFRDIEARRRVELMQEIEDVIASSEAVMSDLAAVLAEHTQLVAALRQAHRFLEKARPEGLVSSVAHGRVHGPD